MEVTPEIRRNFSAVSKRENDAAARKAFAEDRVVPVRLPRLNLHAGRQRPASLRSGLSAVRGRLRPEEKARRFPAEPRSTRTCAESVDQTSFALVPISTWT